LGETTDLENDVHRVCAVTCDWELRGTISVLLAKIPLES